MQNLTVILPAYNEALSLRENFIVIDSTLKNANICAEYVIVDDGSKDDTWKIIKELAKENERIKGISFAKNFGKEIALAAGLDYAEGEHIAIMDIDLQHPPEHISHMLAQMKNENADIVLGRKSNRGEESFIHRFFAKTFYRGLKAMTHLEMQNSSDFMIMNASVAGEVRRFSERNLFFRGIVDWVGFKKTVYYFAVEERADGTESRFSLTKLISLAINAVIAYSSKPLYIIVGTGIIFSIFALILGIQTLWNYATHQALNGFSTVILLLLIGFSIVMFSLGIIGIYLSRIYDEIKARPRYIVQDTTATTGGNNE